MKNSGRWRIGALASAVLLLGSLASQQAQALALGRMTIQSALGEPLRAEVDIADINPEEAASLKAAVASPEAFRAAGLDYNAVAAAGLVIKLERRPDGRAYLRVSSSRPVTEPFVDLIIEAKWASGRISRDYTMLLDPPNLRARATPVEPSAALLSRAPLAAVPVSPSPATAPSVPVPAARPQAPRSSLPPAVALRPGPSVKPPVAERVPARDKQLTVKRGDTASGIAAQNKPTSVSLDQMLVALLRGNPDAFIDGNVNRIKSGAVLDIPGAEAANAVSTSEATQTIVAQSKDFNAFRRKLAGNAPVTLITSADRQAVGKVQAKVEDRAPANATPDKLTLSKGQIQSKATSADEENIARDKQARATASRIAELSKNIAELNQLTAAPGTAVPSAATAGIAVPAPSGLATPAPVAASSPDTAAVASALSAPAASASDSSVNDAASTATPAPAASQTIAASSAVPAVSVAKPVTPAEPSSSEPDLMDQLQENPLLLPGIAALLALLAALGFYRYRQNSKKGQIDSSFLESRLQPDSFFGASGGQRIDTSESHVTGSPMGYTPSQLDATGDVDPVAEADVYLAYGRDLQAEEILREALRSYPARVAIHAKLLEIYAKRQDAKAFEDVAMDAFKLTQGYGPEWAYIAEAGRQLDSANPMYQANGTPAANVRTNAALISANVAAATGLAANVAPLPLRTVDLDLDFSMDDQPELMTAPAAISVSSPYEAPAAPPSPTNEPPLAASLKDLDLDLDLNLDLDLDLDLARATAHPLASQDPDVQDFDFDSGMDFTNESFTQPLPLAASPVPASHPADSGMLEFDMNSLSLDLETGPTTQAPDPASSDDTQDPLEIKLLLAEEFSALGDSDGARSLADEVVGKASGTLKAKAQAFLNTLP